MRPPDEVLLPPSAWRREDAPWAGNGGLTGSAILANGRKRGKAAKAPSCRAKRSRNRPPLGHSGRPVGRGGAAAASGRRAVGALRASLRYACGAPHVSPPAVANRGRRGRG